MSDLRLERLVESKSFDIIQTKAFTLIETEDDGFVLEQAIKCKVTSGIQAAQRLLEALVAKSPDYAAGHYELAVIYKNAKKPDRALMHAELASKIEPGAFRFEILVAHMLFANGAWTEGKEALSSIVPSDDDERLELLAMSDFGDYLKEFPRSKALLIAHRLRQKYYWMNATEVADGIDKAIGERRPFSLIRLGDGDGAHFTVSAEDELKFPHLQKLTRQTHTEFLLGKDVDPVFTGYYGLTSTLASYVSEADILGVAYPSWIAHEYDISSPITLKCLMNINRHFYERDRIPSLILCDQIIHMQLHENNSLDPIMRKLSDVTVVSCLDGLPQRMKEKFSIKNVEFIKIPSETYAPHLYGEQKLAVSLHYPHAFWPTVQQLSVPHNGRVFVIAAGTFGKYYATIIKRHGGIALDLGSLIDGWMKMVSRPGYEMFVDG